MIRPKRIPVRCHIVGFYHIEIVWQSWYLLFGRRIGNKKWRIYNNVLYCVAHTKWKFTRIRAEKRVYCRRGIQKKWSKWYAHNKAIHLNFLMKILPNVKFTRNYCLNEWNAQIHTHTIKCGTHGQWREYRKVACWSTDVKQRKCFIINMPEDTQNDLLFLFSLNFCCFFHGFVANVWIRERF